MVWLRRLLHDGQQDVFYVVGARQVQVIVVVVEGLVRVYDAAPVGDTQDICGLQKLGFWAGDSGVPGNRPDFIYGDRMELGG